jgi:hypothetical protein
MKPVCPLILVCLLAPAAAFAQGNPTFQFAKPEEVKTVEWKAQVKGGLVQTSGNSQTTGGTIAATASRKEGSNRLALEAVAAYGQSNNRVAIVGTDPATGNPAVTNIDRASIVTTNNWVTKGRYDRFFTANNSGYVSGQAAGDKIAGKTFYGGGQIGYSRQLVKNDIHLIVAEIGYDFSYERYVQQPSKTLDPVTIHSARLFVGESAKISDATGASASFEALFNLNPESKALSYPSGAPGVDAFKDTRLVGKVGLTTTLLKRLSIGFGFTLRFDENPAALPVPPLPAGATAGIGYATGFTPFAERFDTALEINLIYSFL